MKSVDGGCKWQRLTLISRTYWLAETAGDSGSHRGQGLGRAGSAASSTRCRKVGAPPAVHLKIALSANEPAEKCNMNLVKKKLKKKKETDKLILFADKHEHLQMKCNNCCL